MDVGAVMELSLSRRTVTVTISGLLDPARMTNGHGALAMDSAALFAPEKLFRELHPEIESFDCSWSIVSDPKKAERVEAALAALLIGLPIAVVVCREVSRQSFSGEIVPYQFPFLEMGPFLLVLLGLEFLLSARTADTQKNSP